MFHYVSVRWIICFYDTLLEGVGLLLGQVELWADVSVLLLLLAFRLPLLRFFGLLWLTARAQRGPVGALVLHLVNVIEILYLHSTFTLNTLVKYNLRIWKEIGPKLSGLSIFKINGWSFSLKTTEGAINILRQLFSHRLYRNVLIGWEGSRLVLIRVDFTSLFCLVNRVRPLVWSRAIHSVFISIGKSWWGSVLLKSGHFFLHHFAWKVCKLIKSFLVENVSNIIFRGPIWGSYRLDFSTWRLMDRLSVYIWIWLELLGRMDIWTPKTWREGAFLSP